MRPHTRNYFLAFGYDQSSFIPCEVCGAPSVDLHHIESRSKFGRKNIALMDRAENIIALCRHHHIEAHGPKSREIKLQLKEIVAKRQMVMK